MKKIKLYISMVIIALAVALVGGATMAWFTAEAQTPVNEFTAGTVKLSATRGEAHTSKFIADNWNPGDTTNLGICVENEGTKSINLRARLDGYWIPSAWRLLIIYSGGNIQLLVVDWDASKGCTGTSGAIAQGDFNYTNPGPSSYMVGTFDNLNNQLWIQDNNDYLVWCVDSSTTIDGSQTGVQIFDPFCNPEWYVGLNIGNNDQWKTIPWTKIAFIINNSPEYLSGEYFMMDIQQAIWIFTNGAFAPGQGGNQDRAEAIVEDTNSNYLLPVENVNFNMDDVAGDDWFEGDEGWWYYKGVIEAGTPNPQICFDLPVYLDPRLTGNTYQGAQFWLSLYFEAVQASNEASNDAWSLSWDGSNWSVVSQ